MRPDLPPLRRGRIRIAGRHRTRRRRTSAGAPHRVALTTAIGRGAAIRNSCWPRQEDLRTDDTGEIPSATIRLLAERAAFDRRCEAWTRRGE